MDNEEEDVDEEDDDSEYDDEAQSVSFKFRLDFNVRFDILTHIELWL